MQPMIPNEKLLCKAEMLVYKSSEVKSPENKPEDMASYQSIVLSFLQLVQFYKTSLWQLKTTIQESCPCSSNTTGSLICNLCQRDCYVAYLPCKYCSHPFCLFHMTCICGRGYTIFQRNDTSAPKDAAKSFQTGKRLR